MHGVFEENAGVFPKVFENEDDYFSYLSETAIFTATRGEVTYYFEPIRAKDYLNKPAIQAWSIHGKEVSIQPSEGRLSNASFLSISRFNDQGNR